MGRSPESSTSRSLITASSGYGLTQGGYTAEMIKLTDRGQAIIEKNDPQAKIDAILSIDIFKAFFEKYRNVGVPSASAAIDFLKEQGIAEQSVRSCLDILLKSGEQVALIQEISGSKRIVSPQHALETLASSDRVISHKQPADQEKKSISPEAELQIPLKAIPSSGKELIPTLHIDIQIHISADAKPEQIDQIFASMAKHLYNKGQ